jgi:hypothetical protein
VAAAAVVVVVVVVVVEAAAVLVVVVTVYITCKLTDSAQCKDIQNFKMCTRNVSHTTEADTERYLYAFLDLFSCLADSITKDQQTLVIFDRLLKTDHHSQQRS